MSPAPAMLPYPGLRAFTRDESMLFFGRENCVDGMIDRLAATRFLAVLGASGSGKSSLVRTGLFDGLELGFFARAGARWKIVETHPGGSPFHNLAVALAGASADGDHPDDVEALLVQGRRSLIEWAGGTRLAPGENLLVLVDQFEELFRYADYSAREEAEAFVALLLESSRATEIPIHLVITMRSEFLGACALIPGLAEQINVGFYLTPRMSREECRQAIEGPAAVAGFTIEPALTNRILNDMAALAPWEEARGVVQGQILSRRADQLPLMQHALNRLWLRTRERSVDALLVLTVENYAEMGGLGGALDAHGSELLASLSPEDRARVPTLFRALVSGPDVTNAVRRAVRFDSLRAELAVATGSDDGSAKRIVDAFRATGNNLLQPVATVPLLPDTVVDISHESLIRQWSDLSAWLSAEARASANWHRLTMAAIAHESGEGELLSGLDLETLVYWWENEHPNAIWAARHGGDFAAAERFLSQSRAAQAAVRDREDTRKRTERRRLVVFAAGASLLASIAIGQLFYLYLQGQTLNATTAEMRAAVEGKEQADRAKEKADRSTQQALEEGRRAVQAAASAAALRDQALAEGKSIADQNGRVTEKLSKASRELMAANAKSKLAEAERIDSEAQLKRMQAEMAEETQRKATLTAEVERLQRIARRQQEDYDRTQRDMRSVRIMLQYCNVEGNRNERICKIVRGDSGANSQ